jgi:NTE family protein
MASGASDFLRREPAPALVLSAGGMFGAWQAGAWSVLGREFRPSAVIGASVGALNGWVIAGGMDADELAARWVDPGGMAGMMRLRIPWLPWQGIFEPQPLEETVREMFAACRPRVPYAATLTEIPRLRRVVVRGEEMTWRHLMAACAMPFGFPPVRIGGRLYVDGGLLEALPLWACPELGVARALALNALPFMPSAVVRGFVHTVRAAAPRVAGCGPEETLRLAPERPLGSPRDSVVWNERRVRAWVARGARDAERLLE